MKKIYKYRHRTLKKKKKNGLLKKDKPKKNLKSRSYKGVGSLAKRLLNRLSKTKELKEKNVFSKNMFGFNQPTRLKQTKIKRKGF